MKQKQQFTPYYFLALNLRDKPVLVIGGGKVAEFKIKKLLEAKAKIKVVSPELTTGLKSLAFKRKISWVPAEVKRADLRSAALVIAATSNESVNASVSKWAKEEGIIINVVDKPSLSDFISPAIFRVYKTVVGVHTDGSDPVLSRDLKNFLKENWNAFLSYRNRL